MCGVPVQECDVIVSRLVLAFRFVFDPADDLRLLVDGARLQRVDNAGGVGNSAAAPSLEGPRRFYGDDASVHDRGGLDDNVRKGLNDVIDLTEAANLQN